VFVGHSFSGLKGWKVLHGGLGVFDHDASIDRDVFLSPDSGVIDLTVPADVALRPLLDIIWNGGGWPGSPNYVDGRWRRPS
jgi:hypothetical protein